MLHDGLMAALVALPFVPRLIRPSADVVPAAPPPLLDLPAETVVVVEAGNETEPPLPAEPGPPGSRWIDEAGRVRKVPREPELRRAVNTHEAVMRFLSWMRDHGLVGWQLDDDVAEAYRWFSAEEGLEEIGRDVLLERVSAAPGVVKQRRRLLGATDPALVRILRRGRERALLYRIASVEEMAEAAPAKPARRKAAAKPSQPQRRAA